MKMLKCSNAELPTKIDLAHLRMCVSPNENENENENNINKKISPILRISFSFINFYFLPLQCRFLVSRNPISCTFPYKQAARKKDEDSKTKARDV